MTSTLQTLMHRTRSSTFAYSLYLEGPMPSRTSICFMSRQAEIEAEIGEPSDVA